MKNRRRLVKRKKPGQPLLGHQLALFDPDADPGPKPDYRETIEPRPAQREERATQHPAPELHQVA